MGFDIGSIASNWRIILIGIFVVIWSIAIHEFGHAVAAYALGDEGPKRDGRLTILPTEHFDPIGFVMILLISLGTPGLGWGKPVMVDPRAFRHPRRDMMLVAAAGPFANLVLATVAGLIMRFTGMGMGDGLTGTFLFEFLFINLSLMFFNLIPITPLDGSKIFSNLLPYEQAARYDRFMAQYGLILLLALVFLGERLLWRILMPPIASVAGLLVGGPLS